MSESSDPRSDDSHNAEPVETEMVVDVDSTTNVEQATDNEFATDVDADTSNEHASTTNDLIAVHLNTTNRFVVTAETQSLLGINFLSSQGGLLPGTSPAPFELFVSNTPRLVTLGTFGRLVTFDGDVTLDVGWNTDHSLDNLVIEIGSASGELLPTQKSGDQFTTLSPANPAKPVEPVEPAKPVNRAA